MAAPNRPDRRPAQNRERPRRTPRPLNPALLDELALAYVARFATSEGKLAAYLARKLRERGWEGDDEPPVAAVVARMAAAGYLNDAAYARMRGASLLRRGLGARRIGQDLAQAGIAEPLRAEALPDAGAARRAALACAQKRRLGPFGPALPDRPLREKQIAVLLRAGHRLDSARELVNFNSIAAAEQWAEDDS
ncbi:MAG: RecX family transcriptional regulator [Proteobacteria bacterium]|nr:RecX family transcriptional regulator [Pseudomonadota bacterium]